MSFKSLIATFKNIDNLNELRSALDTLNQQMETSTDKLLSCYVQIFYSSLEKPLLYLHNRFPNEWQKTYESKEYHLVDPSWYHCKHSTVPFFWSDLQDLTHEQRTMVDDARAHGLRSGVLIPFHGRSGYSLFWIMSPKEESESIDALESAKRMVYELLPFIYESVKTVVFGQESILTKREKEVLYWIAEGLNTDEVSKKLFISPVTVEKHVANACGKLEARNRTQCVRIAMNLGLLVPGETSFDYSIRQG